LPKQFTRPKRSQKLAEFIGIILGDGGISKYQMTITLNRKDDADYVKFVVDLIEKLFNIKCSLTTRESVEVITISRIGIIAFCEKMGLQKGNKIKNQVDIPRWIKENKAYSIACLRGLIDTDGCVVKHQYQVKGKRYLYKKLAFSSRSKPLINSVRRVLNDLDLKSRIDSRGDIRLDSVGSTKKYFEVVGSHNAKHIRRFTE
jgi:intein/homing endonuclease